MLTAVPYYCIPREESGRRNLEFDRLFTLALRWWPEVTIPEGMNAAVARKRGVEQHMGITALDTLRMGSPISKHQLDAALNYLDQAIDWYESGIDEPYPGRNEEAARNLRELREELD